MDRSIYLSLLAIAISSLSLWVSWRTYRRDRPDLRPKLNYFPRHGGQSAFNIRVVNYGRRTARVEQYSIQFKGEEPLYDSVAGGSPVTADFWIPTYDHRGMPARDPTRVSSLVVIDTLGKKYTYPGRSLSEWLEFRRLKARIKKDWQDERGAEHP